MIIIDTDHLFRICDGCGELISPADEKVIVGEGVINRVETQKNLQTFHSECYGFYTEGES